MNEADCLGCDNEYGNDVSLASLRVDCSLAYALQAACSDSNVDLILMIFSFFPHW